MIYFQDPAFSTAYVEVNSPSTEVNSAMLMATCANHWFMFQYQDPSTSLQTSFSSGVETGIVCDSGVSMPLSLSNPTLGILVTTLLLVSMVEPARAVPANAKV